MSATNVKKLRISKEEKDRKLFAHPVDKGVHSTGIAYLTITALL